MSANERSPTFYAISDQVVGKNENRILEALLSDLHNYVTSDTDITDSHFELPSTVKPGTPVAKHYRQALDIYNKFKEIKRAHIGKKKEKDANKMRKKLLKTIEDMEKQIQRLQDENATVKENLRIQLDSNKFIDENWKSDRDLLQSSLARQEIADKQISELQKAYDGEVLKSQDQMQQLYDLQQEKEQLFIRFSKLAGEMLKHENTNLADLSDIDRPTKLHETYSELYDNEWTDAFEELTHQGLTENDAVVMLLDILLVSFRKCREMTSERYRILKYIASTIDIDNVPSSVGYFSEAEVRITEKTSHHLESKYPEEHPGEREQESETAEVLGYSKTVQLSNGHLTEVCNGRNENHLTSTMILSIEQEITIKDIWRTTTEALKQEAVTHLYKILLSRYDAPNKDLTSTSKYLTSCIDLCWKMGAKEKPMYLDIVAEKNDGSEMIFDLDKFRAYTKSGERVAFVVWPALFLHEGGPILYKGIAQGCKKCDC
ncbi:hypothetical protein CHS0354_009731 [Potamilus streckersoni]|uniref:Mitochondria-eating protein n=1 Tax=Potamilus streckersoni TaxID=2493646 RepID=A0AAE0S0C8_9BIVA|nr:hypothetical protein CHS0354_009731 [Potamilus streckersoni]